MCESLPDTSTAAHTDCWPCSCPVHSAVTDMQGDRTDGCVAGELFVARDGGDRGEKDKDGSRGPELPRAAPGEELSRADDRLPMHCVSDDSRDDDRQPDSPYSPSSRREEPDDGVRQLDALRCLPLRLKSQGC